MRFFGGVSGTRTQTPYYYPLSKRVPYQLGLRLHKQDTLLGFKPIHNFYLKKNYFIQLKLLYVS